MVLRKGETSLLPCRPLGELIRRVLQVAVQSSGPLLNVSPGVGSGGDASNIGASSSNELQNAKRGGAVLIPPPTFCEQSTRPTFLRC